MHLVNLYKEKQDLTFFIQTCFFNSWITHFKKRKAALLKKKHFFTTFMQNLLYSLIFKNVWNHSLVKSKQTSQSRRANRWRVSKALTFKAFPLLHLGLPFVRPFWPLWQDTETSKGQSFLLNYFWVRCDTGWMESIKFTSSRNACARTLPSAAKMKSCAFSCSFKTFNSPWKDMTSGLATKKESGKKKTQGRNERSHCEL